MCSTKNTDMKSLIVLFVFHVALSQRRLKNGEELTVNKSYMIYLIRADASPTKYDAWLCGGALVTARSIVTAAACLEDVRFMYAIAGYKTYVKLEELKDNECTNAVKKKVVATCVPKSYDFAYEKIERWSYIDIGIAKVESEYDFTKTVDKCSYAPSKVRINFDEKWQVPGIDAFVLGWGHPDKWREQKDATDYNQKLLHYTTTVIIEKEKCKKEYSTTPALFDIIDRYMICADGRGNIDPQGEIIEPAARITQGCDPSRRHRRPESCEDDYARPTGTKIPYLAIPNGQPNPPGYDVPYGQLNPPGYGQQYGAPNPYGLSYGQPMPENYVPPNPIANNQSYNLRRDGGNSIKEINIDRHPSIEAFQLNATFRRYNRNKSHNIKSPTRRNGICQNDHGGPLITWIGSKEHLIGVASVFRIDENRSCTGPYLYTSTQCNAAFLDCVLSEDPDWGQKPGPVTSTGNSPAETTVVTPPETKNETYRFKRSQLPYLGFSRKHFCELPPEERGFDMVRRQISWVNHPDGPAENELTRHDLETLEIRPQIPMSAYARK